MWMVELTACQILAEAFRGIASSASLLELLPSIQRIVCFPCPSAWSLAQEDAWSRSEPSPQPGTELLQLTVEP